MAENDNTTPKVETKTGTETTPPAASTTPKDVTPPELGVITSDNSGKTDTREDPSKMVETGVESPKAEENTTPTSSPEASSLSLEELQEKQRMGLLSLEEQQALEQKQNQPNDGSLKKKKDNDIDPTDPKEKDFKQDDVINYMYEKWLIAGALWSAEKVEKYFNYGCYKLRAHLQEQNAEKKAKLQGTTTYKTMEKIAGHRNDKGELEGGLYGKKKKEIMDRFEQTNKDITDIGIAINDGTLFDGQNKELLKKYEKMIGADTEEGKKRLEATRKACETRKANPENEEAALGSKKIAAEFARDARINLTFDTKAEFAALELATANVLTGISYNKDKCSTAEKDFATQFDANVKKIKEITQSDRETALAKADERDKLQAQYTAYKGIKKPYGEYMSSKVEKQWEQSFSTLNKIEKNAKDGIVHAQKDIASGHIVELGKEPRPNTSLDAANRLIAAKHTVTTLPQRTTTQEVETPPVAPEEPKKTLQEEAIVQAQTDEEITKKQKAVETDPRTAENARREQAHEDRGKKINPRIEEIKARALASRQAKQSGAEFMIDAMLANGNLTDNQQNALLDAGIKAQEAGKDGSTDQILKNMRETGQFSQDQIKAAREINFAYELAQKQVENSEKNKKFIRFCFIGAVWSFIYFGIVAWLMKWIWKFDIFGKRYWVKISRFWQDGGVIDTAQEYFFVIALIAIIPLWIWGWRKAMKVSIAKIIFFPVFWYNNYQEKKYAQLPKSITLKNMGAKVGTKQTPQQMLEEMISSRMPKQKDKKDLNSSKIRSSFEEKNKTFHEKVGK